MAYLPHCKVILRGVLGASALSGNEIWSTGHQISDTNFANLPSQSQANAIAGAWADFFSSSEGNYCSNAYLTDVTIVAIESDGTWRKNTDGSWMKVVASNVLLPAAGYTNAAREYPVSSVISLLTPRAGAHGRGRMYWPLPAETPDTTGYAAQGTQATRASRAADAFALVNSTLATGTYNGVACVASAAGFNSPVTAVRIGNVHDTQRRRRNNLVETYSVNTV